MNRPGQVLIIVLLTLAVVATIGLAVVSRSVTEVGVSTVQEESAQALAAAEAGIEAALSASGTVEQSGVAVGSAGGSYTVSTSKYGQGSSVSLIRQLTAGETETIFLSDHDDGGNFVPGLNKYGGSSLRLCWGQNVAVSAETAPAIEVELYYQTPANVVKVGRQGYDANVGRGATNNFQPAGSGGNCPVDQQYAFQVEVPLSALGKTAADIPLFLRLRSFYNGDTPHYIAAVAIGGDFPAQGRLVVSTGQTGSVSRKVEVFQKYPDPFGLFDNALFSGGGLTK